MIIIELILNNFMATDISKGRWGSSKIYLSLKQNHQLQI